MLSFEKIENYSETGKTCIKCEFNYSPQFFNIDPYNQLCNDCKKWDSTYGFSPNGWYVLEVEGIRYRVSHDPGVDVLGGIMGNV